MQEFTTKVCRKCGVTKPINDFYANRTEHGFNHQCKECAKSYQKKQPIRKQRDEHSGRPYEQLAIDALRSNGIFATSGKSSIYAFGDIVAWGCIRIEVKYSTLHGQSYTFSFQNKTKLTENQLVMLGCQQPDGIDWYVVPSSHSMFHHPNGDTKRGISFSPFVKHRKLSLNAITTETLQPYKEAWHMVIECRNQVSLDLIAKRA